MQNYGQPPKKNFGKMFILEILVLFFSLVPLIVMYMAPAIVNMPIEQFTNEEYLFIYGFITYILYPVISVILAFVVGLMDIKWHTAALCGPLSYFIGATLFMMNSFGIGFAEITLWCVIYYVVSILFAFLANRWRARREDVNRLMPTRAASKRK